MIRIDGRFAEAVVYAGELEESAEGQIRALCDQRFAEGARIRVMPDVHAGVGCTIGTTMTIVDKVVPNLVGVDIGCGMETVRLRQKRLELPKLDSLIKARIPSGMTVRERAHRAAEGIDLSRLRCAARLNIDRGYLSVGTLGGGNHFIEVDADEAGQMYLVIHSGSRRLGLEVARYYQQAAWDQLGAEARKEREALIARLRDEGREEEMQALLKEAKAEPETPFQLAYVSGALFDDYIHDMAIVQRFADINRRAMAEDIIKGMKLDVEGAFTTIHNYIDTESMILRKGAVAAKAGQRLLIPINMRDGSLVCLGRGNEEWNFSAPHGAGRLMSRRAAKDSFTVSEFKRQMKGVFSSTVSAETLDECPMAYKPMEDILGSIGPTADVERVIKPIYNFKAAGD